jgi:hypothetical protein
MAAIEPEPSDSVREAILAALAEPGRDDAAAGWAAAALSEAVDADAEE